MRIKGNDETPFHPLLQDVVKSFPHPIAVKCKEIIQAENWTQKGLRCVRTAEILVRYCSLIVISQYILWDLRKGSLNDPDYNEIQGLRLSTLAQAHTSLDGQALALLKRFGNLTRELREDSEDIRQPPISTKWFSVRSGIEQDEHQARYSTD